MVDSYKFIHIFLCVLGLREKRGKKGSMEGETSDIEKKDRVSTLNKFQRTHIHTHTKIILFFSLI